MMPDYRPDYRVTTAHGKRAPAVVRLFIFGGGSMNLRTPDYRSQDRDCSHPVVRLKALILQKNSHPLLLTTFRLQKEKKEKKWWAVGGNACAREKRSQHGERKCLNLSRSTTPQASFPLHRDGSSISSQRAKLLSISKVACLIQSSHGPSMAMGGRCPWLPVSSSRIGRSTSWSRQTRHLSRRFAEISHHSGKRSQRWAYLESEQVKPGSAHHA